MLKLPIVIINFKTYPEATGRNAVKLAKICERVGRKHKASIAVAVQPTDLQAVTKAVTIPVLAQHADPEEQGGHTGSISPEAIKQAGAAGSLLNHSEKRLDMTIIGRTIERLKKQGLVSIVCVSIQEEAQQIDYYKPSIIAIEPTELIGGNVSISEARPDLIKETLHVTKNAKLICGAGIKNKKDAAKALALGAKGILVSSGVVKAKNPAKALSELIAGLQNRNV